MYEDSAGVSIHCMLRLKCWAGKICWLILHNPKGAFHLPAIQLLAVPCTLLHKYVLVLPLIFHYNTSGNIYGVTKELQHSSIPMNKSTSTASVATFLKIAKVKPIFKKKEQKIIIKLPSGSHSTFDFQCVQKRDLFPSLQLVTVE